MYENTNTTAEKAVARHCREIQGGEMMCEYCEGGKPIIGDEQDGADIGDSNLLTSYGECHEFARGRINFCPMCGRKLNKQPPVTEEMKNA